MLSSSIVIAIRLVVTSCLRPTMFEKMSESMLPVQYVQYVLYKPDFPSKILFHNAGSITTSIRGALALSTHKEHFIRYISMRKKLYVHKAKWPGKLKSRKNCDILTHPPSI